MASSLTISDSLRLKVLVSNPAEIARAMSEPHPLGASTSIFPLVVCLTGLSIGTPREQLSSTLTSFPSSLIPFAPAIVIALSCASPPCSGSSFTESESCVLFKA